MGGHTCEGSGTKPSSRCPEGHFCIAGTFSPQPCPAGTYGVSEGSVTELNCTEAPRGSYSRGGVSQPLLCPPGRFSDTEGSSECSICLAGHACEAGTDIPVPCAPGNASASGAEHCEPCPAGHWCAESQTPLWNATRCPAGTFCREGRDTPPDESLDACPAGYYCPIATPAPLPCPAGTHRPEPSATQSSDCEPCPAGSWCALASGEVTGSCAPGHACPIGSTGPYQEPCPGGRFRVDRGAKDEFGCDLCNPGSFCPPGAADQKPCREGHFCPGASSIPPPCPVGRFSNTSEASSAKTCFSCTPGEFCDSPGLSMPVGPCDPGFYCPGGDYTGSPERYVCPAGGYCTLGSPTPSLCPPGRYNNRSGSDSETACSTCDPGKYCAGFGNALPTGPCRAGYFCSGGAASATQEEAPTGHWSSPGSAIALACSVGTFNPEVAQQECRACPPRYFCPSQGMSEAEPCPAGSFCSESTFKPVPCPLSTFSSSAMLQNVSECTFCTPGSYCASSGLTEPTGLCDNGYYCPGADVSRNPSIRRCPPGSYCPIGSAGPVACPLGRWSTASQLSDMLECTPCVAGSYCGDSGLTAPSGLCRKGYYCTGGAVSATPHADDGSNGPCPRGHACPEGTVVPAPCPPSTFSNTTGLSSCHECEEGFFCDGSVPTRYDDCPEGFYCPVGTAIPIPCPPGRYSGGLRRTSADTCSVCDPGAYCANSGLLLPTGPCEAGYFCPTGCKDSKGEVCTSNE